jgi:hypothetical protein
VVAEPREPGRGEVYGEHGKLRVVVFGPDRFAEPVRQEDSALGARQRFQGNARGQRLPVAIVVPPADFEILLAGVIPVAGQVPGGMSDRLTVIPVWRVP